MGADADVTVTREIAQGARVHPSARIGPFCTIGPDVVIGAGTVLSARVRVWGKTIIGRDNLIQDGCVLGSVPQDLKYRGRSTWLLIGDRNHFGPNVTAHVGTEEGGFLTRIGNDNVLDAGAHVAHDCFVDDRTHLGRGVLLAGHIRVEDGAVIEDLTGAHHFTTIGRFSRVASRTPVRRDVPPYTVFSSLGYYTAPPAVRGVHEPGLTRAGLSEQEKPALRSAIRYLFADQDHRDPEAPGPRAALVVKLEELCSRGAICEPVRQLSEFCRRTLAGRFGRYREIFRGRIPPETRTYLPAGAVVPPGTKTTEGT